MKMADRDGGLMFWVVCGVSLSLDANSLDFKCLLKYWVSILLIETLATISH